jgi:hypothetical protein
MSGSRTENHAVGFRVNTDEENTVSNANHSEAIALMVETITLVTTSDQLHAVSQKGLEELEGGAGLNTNSRVANDLENASEVAGMIADFTPGTHVGLAAEGISVGLDVAAKATVFIDDHPAIGNAAKSVAHDISSVFKSIF